MYIKLIKFLGKVGLLQLLNSFIPSKQKNGRNFCQHRNFFCNTLLGISFSDNLSAYLHINLN